MHKTFHLCKKNVGNVVRTEMGKSTRNGNKSHLPVKPAEEDVSKKSPLSISKSGEILIKINARPSAKISCIKGLTEDGVDIDIAAPPTHGEANEELIKILSKSLGVKKSCMSLIKGSKSRQKCVSVGGTTLLELESIFKQITSS